MSVLCLNIYRLCVPNTMSLGMFKRITPRQSWHVWLIQRQNSRYFRRPAWLKDEKLIKKAYLHVNWNIQTLFQNILF